MGLCGANFSNQSRKSLCNPFSSSLMNILEDICIELIKHKPSLIPLRFKIFSTSRVILISSNLDAVLNNKYSVIDFIYLETVYQYNNLVILYFDTSQYLIRNNILK